MKKFSLEELKNRGSDFGLLMHGYLNVKSSGDYQLFVSTNDGSKLLIDNREIINNDGAHATREKSGKIFLKKGIHLVELRYFQAGGGKEMRVLWQGPEFEKREMTNEDFFRN